MIIRIDAGKCKSIVQGYAQFEDGMSDYFYYNDYNFGSGKAYGLVSEYQEGCMYLSYLLGGRINSIDDLEIFLDNKKILAHDLYEMSWNLEPSNEKYKNKIVKKSIEEALNHKYVKESFEEISKAFYLTEARFDRKLKNLSGERWRASAALGYSLGKRIFFAPYKPSNYFQYLSETVFTNVISFLKDKDCLVVLPVGSDRVIKGLTDEIIYILQKPNCIEA